MASRQVKLHEVYQARVTVEKRGKKRKETIPVNYDSQLVFPSQELAEKFVPYYVRELIEIGLLSIDQEYEAGVLQLHVFDGAIDIGGVEAAS